jgi:hypothetical protein
MKELYIEDLANHGGPEPCVGVPRGRSEALDRGARRPAIEPRKANVWGADALTSDGRQYRWRRFRESSVGPAGSENLCMRAISPCSRTGRAHSHPCLSVMPRPIWVAGWRVGGCWVVRGRLRP